MATHKELLTTVGDGATRVVTPTNPLVINAAIGNYGAVEIAGGNVSVIVPVTLVQFTSLTKTS